VGSPLVTIEDRDGLALVRIDRPPANAMTPDLLEAMIAAVEELASDAPRAVVLAGREGFFSAGADLKVVPTLGPEDLGRMARGINAMAAGWYAFPRPVVCALTGHAIAGGMVLALCGDHRVASQAGRYGLTEARAGIPYPTVAIAVVRSELSPAAARRLSLGAELVDADQARLTGLVDEVVEPGGVLDRAFERAAELAEVVAYAAVKAQLRAPGIAFHARVLTGDEPATPADWIEPDVARAAAIGILGRR
jgi:enoyl-CoA hydratase/carnithine racemase